MPFRLANRSNFTVKDLAVIDFCLEAIIENEESFNCFREYLSSSHNSELVMFIQEANKYKVIKSEKNRIKKAQHIIDEFIKVGATHELNISSPLKQAILTSFENNEINSNLFDDLEISILVNLKEGHFKTFLQSDNFLKYVQNSGLEALYDLGVVNGAVPTSLKDSIINIRTDHFIRQDIEFLKSRLTSDLDSEWDLIQTSTNHRLYSSKQLYEFGSIPQDKMIRVEMEFKCNPLELIHTLFNSQLRKKYDVNLVDVQPLSYIPRATKSEEQLASSLVLETHQLYFPLAMREFPTLYTCVKDNLGNYIVCKKSCDCPELPPPKKGNVRAVHIHGVMIQQVEENRCKFSKVVLVDFKGSVPRSMIMNYFKKRFKTMHKEISKILERNENKNYRCDHKVLNTLTENKDIDI
ncbi:hypothetical protein ABK040_008236 [Willaertia magna]